MDTVYTIDQLDKAWVPYKTDKIMKVLAEGKWTTQAIGTPINDKTTRAQVVTFDKAVSFPTFLRVYYG